MADIVTMAKDELKARGKADAAALAARAVSGEADGQELLDNTGNEGWTPPEVPALWAAVSKPGETGTQENPITAARGMEYTYGLYYRDPEDNLIYLCERTGEAEGGKITLQYLPHELVGQYFTEVQS